MVKVKICGLKDEANVRMAVENGADFLGFVFFDKSPRNIAINEAKNLAKFAKNLNSEIKICAVLVNPDDELLNDLKNTITPDFVQVHKLDDLDRINEIKAQGFKIILGIGIENDADIE
ncbi:MAG: N-(5'-phosphoribosyl)anthranilate isomerase, partial [Caulobacterales bacterium]|nr:N-(5'-phosphoribosyl)anthranilate isomerase [Caulobacterales bacterium]